MPSPLEQMTGVIAASAWVVRVAMDGLSDQMQLQKKLDDPNCQEPRWGVHFRVNGSATPCGRWSLLAYVGENFQSVRAVSVCVRRGLF